MDLELKGKTVLITGASRGIGRACAAAFAAEGCNLHLAARSADKLAEAGRSLRRQLGVMVVEHAIDLAQPGAAAELAQRCGAVDVLVNNAAAIADGAIDEVDEERWRATWDVKVFGYINLTRAMLKPMYARRSGIIVNVIGGGVLSRYNFVCGTAGNAALAAFTNAVGSHSTDYGVRVVGLNPPRTATERAVAVHEERALKILGEAGRWREMLADLPFGRPCEPREVADMIVFLSSARASYMSGSVVTMDGGAAHRLAGGVTRT